MNLFSKVAPKEHCMELADEYDRILWLLVLDAGISRKI